MGKAGKRQARERLAEQRRRDAERSRRNRTLTVTGAAIVVIIAVVAGGIAIARSRDDSAPSAGRYTGPLAPVTVDPARTTATMAAKGVMKPRLDVYEDFQCPYCKRFEESTGSSVVRPLAAKGKVRVVYHLLTFVNPVGSPRAAAAAMCVPADRWMRYHDALYARQPAEAQDPRQSAFTVDRLRAIGSDAGLDAKTLGCVGKQAYARDAQANTQKATTDDHIQSTPTLLLDGKTLPWPDTVLDRDKLSKAITG